MSFTSETARRAMRTFFQAFVPSLAAGIVEAVKDGGSLTVGVCITLLTPAIAAGIAAIMNREAKDLNIIEPVSADNFITEVDGEYVEEV